VLPDDIEKVGLPKFISAVELYKLRAKA